MTARLLAVQPFPEAVARRAAEEFSANLSQDRPMTPDELVALAGENKAEALVTSSALKYTAALIAALPASIKILATSSVGYEHIDLAAAAQRGLIVTNTPDVVTAATADLTLMLLLCACRRTTDYAAIMAAGWRQRYELNQMLGLNPGGKTLGILGMGQIGRAVAARARAFGMKIIYHNQRRLPPELAGDATYYASFDAMLPHCQFLSLHAPGGPATDKILGTKAISLLPKGAVVINAARGTLVDEDALIEALQSGHLAAAGLDVFRKEPDYDLRFRDLKNVFLTPHMGSATVETRNAMGMRALDNVAAVLGGKPPIDPVT